MSNLLQMEPPSAAACHPLSLHPDESSVTRPGLPFGATVLAEGGVQFNLYAPAAQNVDVELDGEGMRLPMQRSADGWFRLRTEEAHAGTRYSFVLPDGQRVPDPASRFQPDGVHEASEVVAPEMYRWRDAQWRGRPWQEAVLYELHVGTFTAEGTFAAAADRLDHLADLGVTAVEVMPIGAFPGSRGWGYDGVLMYAPYAGYGRPEDFKSFVDAAHERGISVLLDVVYNHFGPEGNYIQKYYPELLTAHHKTAWGDAVNFDSENHLQARELVLHNALYWVEEFHLDGLRLDAVHAILDDGPRHVLAELAERLRAAVTTRPLHLILENEKNEAHWLARDPDGRPAHFTAQWNDDIHHVLHTAGTSEGVGYYIDFKGDTEKLGRALAQGFAFQGEVVGSTGEERGEMSGDLPPIAFVAFIQNHDQIGNRAFGERISHIARPEAVRAITAIYLLLPQIPLLFMGEEWDASQPFPYFCDFDQELGEKVSQGRRKEFAAFPEFADPEKLQRIPDPQAESTFASAKLDWSELKVPKHDAHLRWYTHILAMRRACIVPLLCVIGGKAGHYRVVGPGAISIQWKVDGVATLLLDANLSDTSQAGFASSRGKELWREGQATSEGELSPWAVRWALEENSEVHA